MSFSVNTNAAAMAAMRMLNKTNDDLTNVQERINSGLKINGARDNASTFAIAAGMRSDVAAFKAIQDSLAMGEAVANVAVSAGTEVLKKLQDLQIEAVKALDPTTNRTMVQEAVSSIRAQIDDVVSAAQFNGVNLLNGVDPDLSVLASLNRTDPNTYTTSTLTVRTENMTGAALGIAGLNVEAGHATLEFGPGFAAAVADAETIEFTVAGATWRFEFIDDPAATGTTLAENIPVAFDAGDSQGTILGSLMRAMQGSGFSVAYNSAGELEVTHAAGDLTGIAVSAGIGAEISNTVIADGNPNTALNAIDAAMTAVKTALARLGTSANAVASQQDFVKALTDELTSGIGALVDADLAEESARLQALQTRQQLGIQALSIANQAPGAVLRLFQ